MNVELRPLNGPDLEDLREWRNFSRDSFFDSRIIETHDEQLAWFWGRYLNGIGPRIYTILFGTVRVGFIGFKRLSRYDAPLQHVEVGPLITAPQYRGKGIMISALRHMRRLFQKNTLWVAHVKPDNHASLRLFEKAGFIRLRPRRTSCRKSRS